MSFRQQNGRNDDRKEDKPPYSRIFVVCSKRLCEEDLRNPFNKFGTIEDLYMPKDRSTGESRGVAYIKYSRTSSAAAAIQEMNMKTLPNENKPLKVIIASNKNDNSQDINEDKYRRLFIKVSKQATENEISDYFSKFGYLEAVHIQKDKVTEENRGFAYVKFGSFLHTAKALEECDSKYKPMFATPKEEVLLKRSRNSLDSNFDHNNIYSGYAERDRQDRFDSKCQKRNLVLPTRNESYKTINVSCSSLIPQKCIEKLFNVIPGMLQCQFTSDMYNGFCKAIITYEDESQAVHAVDRLNNFEFPSGEIISVTPHTNMILSKAANELNSIVNSFKHCIDGGNTGLLELANVIAQASSLITKATSGSAEDKLDKDKISCSVDLPPPQPMANSNSRVAQRCFLVFKPHPPPFSILQDAFCRFGDLIDVATFPGKTFGFAKYASVKSAQDAIKTLNMATLCGVKLKVMEANEKPKDGVASDKIDIDCGSSEDHDIKKKRIKLDDN